MPCKSDRQKVLQGVEMTLITSLWKMKIADRKSQASRTNPTHQLTFDLLITAIIQMKNLLSKNLQLVQLSISLVNFQLRKSAISLHDNMVKSGLHQSKSKLAMLLSLVQELTSAQYVVPRTPLPRIATISRTYEVLTHTTEEARMTRKSFFALADALKDHHIFYNNSNNPQAPGEMQLIVALSHLGMCGNGGSPHVLAQYYNISPGSVENYTNRCMLAIIKTLERKHVYWPNAQQRATLTETLQGKTVFDGCISFVDGTIFPLASAPTKHKEDYWMRCVTSVKWIGLFVTALVGAHTLDELWEKFGDLRMPIRTYIQHWIARILCLVILPVLVYMSFFKIHFLILNRSGPGDAQMSSLFQANLYGNDFARSPLEIAIGSKVTIKNMGFGGGLLHSHVQSYPTGSQQQQVTCYHYRDANNEWTVTPLLHEPTYDETQPMKFLKHGSVVRLVHTFTGRNLHTHSIPAPITTLNHEVACYGNATVDDSNSYWMIEVVDDTIRGRRKNFENIHILSTRFRIRNLNLGCYLRAANAILPQWGFKQVEVSCDKQNDPSDQHTYWNVEGHINPRLPEGDMKLMKSPFLRDFWHLNVAMMTANNALIPDPDKEDVTASTPFEWPFLYTGMRMNAWIDQGIKFYLIGNPLTWWLCSFSLIIYSVSLVWYLGRYKRQINDLSPVEWRRFIFVGKVALGGWILHYAPFLFMGRVTYMHHYFPALWFSILMFGLMVDHFIFKAKTSKLISLTKLNKLVICLTLCLSILFTGIWFKDCAWGIIGPVHLYKYRQWRKSWSIYEDHTTG
ncbi:hypothetical protein PSTG_16647 [Puccinia striiformis f. sp. tritici PST-78]|uniref:Dolichyl-phosphate-mannose--protein mannosyltransferase n=1 Tax=Puccinia striiformis f. sp. tritici PST-78 TaxID=1165861 RepID=A0A0L0UT30_9BASI|nr:hypothetical protein PSTG_16647 [Puccinia striiformis f. sp. tritici PST-78]